jgi:hypothetical protein
MDAPDTKSPTEHNKLCIDVVADLWAKRHNDSPDKYKDQQKAFTHYTGDDDIELNRRWEQMMRDYYKSTLHNAQESDLAADKVFDEFRKRAHCD